MSEQQQDQQQGKQGLVRLVDIKKKLGFERDEVYGGKKILSCYCCWTVSVMPLCISY